MTSPSAPADDVRVLRLRGAAIAPWLDAVAALRIGVFRAWPYLYDGDAAYEREYLRVYADSPDSVCVLALAGDTVAGASTGLPLADDSAEFQAPWRAAGQAVAEVFYFGESVLLPAYRGRGLGHRFFDEREAHAHELGRFAVTAFAAVNRDPADPRRPRDHRDNDAFWCKRGYVCEPGLTMQLAWREIGADAATEKSLTFWTRRPGADRTPESGGAGGKRRPGIQPGKAASDAQAISAPIVVAASTSLG